MRSAATLLLSLFSLAQARPFANVPGFQLIWGDEFDGPAGALPDRDKWKIITDLHHNNEVQTYTTSNRNLQISGGSTVQLVPLKSNGKWTSSRIESLQAFTPAPGKITLFTADIRFGNNVQANKQGLWPAFWMLGESVRHGTPWPQCGELDIMETVNGLPTAYGTVHCGPDGNASGGPCNEPIGRGGTVSLEDYGWHNWALQVDRTNGGDWRGEVIRWLKDGAVFHEISGAAIGDEKVWKSLARSPMFFVLNVAVGGNW